MTSFFHTGETAHEGQDKIWGCNVCVWVWTWFYTDGAELFAWQGEDLIYEAESLTPEDKPYPGSILIISELC